MLGVCGLLLGMLCFTAPYWVISAKQHELRHVAARVKIRIVHDVDCSKRQQRCNSPLICEDFGGKRGDGVFDGEGGEAGEAEEEGGGEGEGVVDAGCCGVVRG